MKSLWRETVIQRAVVATCALLIALPASFAQAPADPNAEMPDTQQAALLLSPDQLNNLVAPIALYPDPLLSQVLAASTYPLEIVEAQQWIGQNSNLQGAQLMDAARQQNWDPSVQALVAFPDALSLLANDIRWTTDLGNAFLAQQADVMSAVQRMRAEARSNGKLNTTPQQVVTTATQDGQDAVEILPADPQVIYVPIYSPSYVWGPPVWGAYPDLWYPSGFGFGFGYGPGIYMGAFFPELEWLGWLGMGCRMVWPQPVSEHILLQPLRIPRRGLRASRRLFGSRIWRAGCLDAQSWPPDGHSLSEPERGEPVQLEPVWIESARWRSDEWRPVSGRRALR